jgi:hypothetical protein
VTNTQVVAVYHHAAALYANANGNNPLYALYSYALPASAIQYASGLGFQKIYFGGPAVLFDYLPIAGYNNNTQYGSGIALEVNSAGQFGPNNGQPVATLASFTPVSADPANTGDYMPSTSGGQGLTPNSYNLSGADANVALFVVDNGAGGVSLIGTFTP